MDQERAREYRESTNFRYVEELRAFQQIDADPGAPEGCENMTLLEKFEYVGRKLDAYSGSSLVNLSERERVDSLSDDAYRYSPDLEPEETKESYSLPEVEVEPAFGYYGPLTLRIDVHREDGVLQAVTAWWSAEFMPIDQFGRLDAALQPSGPPSNHGPMHIDRDLRWWEEIDRWTADNQHNETRADIMRTMHQLMRSAEVYEQNSVIQPEAEGDES